MSAGQLTLRVALEDREPFDVTTRLIDHNVWDLTRAKHKWPTPNEAPMTWLGFLAWAAARRTGAIETGLTWELFLAATEGVENVTEDETTADPTRPVPGAG
jgi:hypothetical protein